MKPERGDDLPKITLQETSPQWPGDSWSQTWASWAQPLPSKTTYKDRPFLGGSGSGASAALWTGTPQAREREEGVSTHSRHLISCKDGKHLVLLASLQTLFPLEVFSDPQNQNNFLHLALAALNTIFANLPNWKILNCMEISFSFPLLCLGG